MKMNLSVPPPLPWLYILYCYRVAKLRHSLAHCLLLMVLYGSACFLRQAVFAPSPGMLSHAGSEQRSSKVKTLDFQYNSERLFNEEDSISCLTQIDPDNLIYRSKFTFLILTRCQCERRLPETESREERRADRGNMRSCQESGDLLSGILIHGFICIRAQALHLMIQQKISPIHRTWQSRRKVHKVDSK